jgi:hypothetical protein
VPPPDPLDDLLGFLADARDAATARAGREPLGLRAVELGDGARRALCAFPGPAFLCLDPTLAPERSELRARQVAAAGLLVEHAEGLVDAGALRDLAAAAGRVLALQPEGADLEEALGEVAEAALALAAWRDAPERALASLAALDTATARQERLLVGYGAFVAASDPLVAVQDRLPAPLVEALRALEEAAGRAGATGRLAERLADAMAGCEQGAAEITAAHLTPLA